MKVSDLRNYNVAFSDAESTWPEDVKKRMRAASKKLIMSKMSFSQKLKFPFVFLSTLRRARAVDLSAFRARGLTNETFIDQQVEYIAMFITITRLFDGDAERATEIMNEVMERAAHEPMLLCLPRVENVRQFDDPLGVFREYLGALPEASQKAGCHDLHVAESSEDAYQFNVTWCVWLELARALGAPEACRSNCHADDLVFPEYFASIDIRYQRTKTLACGGDCCDFRFERAASPATAEE